MPNPLHIVRIWAEARSRGEPESVQNDLCDRDHINLDVVYAMSCRVLLILDTVLAAILHNVPIPLIVFIPPVLYDLHPPPALFL